MLYVNQRENEKLMYICNTEDISAENEWMHHSSFAKTGCGICSAVMVIDRLLPNTDFSLTDAIQLSYDTKANHEPGTDYGIYAPALAEKFDLKLKMSSDPEDLLHCLKTGGVCVVNVGGDREGWAGVYCGIGHYIVAISQIEDERICVLDSDMYDGKFDRFEQVNVDGMPGVLPSASTQRRSSSDRSL